MPWRFVKGEEHKDPEVNGEVKPPEKTDAELLAETVNSAVGTALATALKPISDALGTVATRVESVEQRFSKPPEKHDNGGEGNGETTVSYPSVFDDEDAAIGTRVVRAVAPIMQQQYEMQANLNFNEVKSEYEAKGYGELFAQFGDKIRGLVASAPLVTNDGKPYRGDKEYIRRVFNMVFGEAAIQKGVKLGGKDQGFFLESTGGSPDAAGGNGGQVTGLTQEQITFAKKNKIPLDAYKSTVSKMKFVN